MASMPILPSITSDMLRRRNVTRACDACKKRKVKCDGYHPCVRCTRSSLDCTYNAAYNRIHGRNTTHANRRLPQQQSLRRAQSSNLSSPVHIPQAYSHVIESSSGQQDENAEEETYDEVLATVDNMSDASVHAFLQKVSGHLGRIGQGLPRSLFKRHEESSWTTADARYVQPLVLPDLATATSYFDAYFDHGNATCRFLVRDEVLANLRKLYANESKMMEDHTRMAIVLLVIGTGCVWSASYGSKEPSPFRERALPLLQAATYRLERVDRVYPPTIGVLQAQVLKCQCELVLGRFNSAWMSLGWAVRLGQMIDIQRELPSNADKLEAFHRQRLFWSMFMIDRYLAVILGRPMAIHEKDITVKMITNVDDSISSQVDSREKKLLVGTAAHYGLVSIIGKATSDLYPVANSTAAPAEEIVSELESEIQQWLQSTPAFFHPKCRNESPKHAEEHLFDVPWILKRQQRTVQAAYLFTNMLIYRGYLLQEFSRHPVGKNYTEPFGDKVRKCVDNAVSMIELSSEFGVDLLKYNGTFWITSHFVFCAISILVVYCTLCQDANERAVIEKAVEDGMRFHRKLKNKPNISAQRLLDESHIRAQVVQKIKTPTSSMAEQVSPGDLNMDSQTSGLESGGNNNHTKTIDDLGAVQTGGTNVECSDVLSMSGLDQLDFEDGFDTIMNFGFDNWVDPGTFSELNSQF